MNLTEAKKYITEHLIGRTGLLKSAILGSEKFKNGDFWRWVEQNTTDLDTTAAGKIWSVFYEFPKCPICKTKPLAYYNGMLKTCGNLSCVSQSKGAAVSEHIRLNGRSTKQKQFVQDNLDNFLKKSKDTIQQKYGVSNPYNIPHVKEAARSGKILFLETTKNIRNLARIKKLEDDFNISITSVDQKESLWINFSCNKCNKTDTKTFYSLVHRLKHAQTVCASCGNFTSGSIEQANLYSYICQYEQCEQNNRKEIAPLELDIFIPLKRLAIEYHGIFWHSANSDLIDSKYCFNKYLQCKEKDIKLLQIWSHWEKEKVKNLINHHLNLDFKIGARKTKFSVISKREAHTLLKTWHLDNSVACENSFCLKNKMGEVIAVATFGKNRFKKDEIELLRMAFKPGITVVGGVSKLIQNSMRTMETKEIITYAKCELGGDGYLKSGGEFIGYTPPAESWVNLSTGEVKSRLNVQKHKLKNILENFDENKTARENLFSSGWRVFYSAGNSKFRFPLQ